MERAESDSEGFLTRLVLDVLKPHKPTIIEVAQALLKIPGVRRVNIMIQEMDAETETTQIVIEGKGVRYQDIVNVITHLGASIHSIDEVEMEKTQEQQEEERRTR